MTHFLSNREIYERVVCGIVPQARERLWIATARHSASPRLSPRYARPSLSSAVTTSRTCMSMREDGTWCRFSRFWTEW